MHLADLIGPEAVIASLKVKTKKQLLQELSARAARLDAEGEADSVRHAHARHYAEVAERTMPVLKGETPGDAIRLLSIEHENLRQALEHLFDRSPGEAANLAATLWPFWDMSGHYSEGYDWVDRALEVGAIDPSVRVKMLLGAGDITSWSYALPGELDALGQAAE